MELFEELFVNPRILDDKKHKNAIKNYLKINADERNSQRDLFIKQNPQIFNDIFVQRIKRAVKILKAIFEIPSYNTQKDLDMLELVIILLNTRYNYNIPIFSIHPNNPENQVLPSNTEQAAYFKFINSNMK